MCFHSKIPWETKPSKLWILSMERCHKSKYSAWSPDSQIGHAETTIYTIVLQHTESSDDDDDDES